MSIKRKVHEESKEVEGVKWSFKVWKDLEWEEYVGKIQKDGKTLKDSEGSEDYSSHSDDLEDCINSTRMDMNITINKG